MLCALRSIFLWSAGLVHHCRNHLYKQDQEYHCNRIYRRIGYTRDIAVYHRVGSRKSRRTGHTAGNGTQQIEQADLKHQTSDERSNQHRH